MAQITARDVDYSSPKETGRYALELPFANYPSPNTNVRKITRSYKVSHGSYSPSITNLTSWTNLLTQSQTLAGTAWTSTAATVTDNATTFADGTMTMASVVETATSNIHGATNATGATLPAGSVTASAFVKPNGRNYVIIGMDDGGGAHRLYVNLSTGASALGTTGCTPLPSVKMSDGSWRIAFTFTAAGGGASFYCLNSPDGTSISYAGTAGLGVYCAGVQVVAGTLPGPYVPTTTAVRTVLAPDVDAIVNPLNASAGTGEDCDPLAYQCQESDPTGTLSGLLEFTKTYSRIPPEFITPSSYLFTTPNYSGNQQGALPGTYSPQLVVIGFYGVLANITLTVGTTLINAYYDVAYPVTGSSGGPPSQITVPGNNYVAGDMLLMDYAVNGTSLWACNVLSVSGSTVYIVAFYLTDNTTDLLVSQVVPLGYVRKVIKDYPDAGQVIGLRAQIIEDYYLPGVTSGINTFTDIPAQNPFNIVDYFAAYAGQKTWFNVQADALAVWMGQILVRKYTQAQLPALVTHGETAMTSSGTFTVPAGITWIRRVWIINGGGGGGYGAGGGGGGGSITILEGITTTPGATFAVVIGAGGAGGTSGSPTGGSGGLSTFAGSGSTVAAVGGGGGTSGTTGGAGGAGAYPTVAGGSGGTSGGSTRGGGGGGGGQNSTGVSLPNGSGTAGGNGGTAGGGGGACTGQTASLGGTGMMGNGGGGGAPTVAGATPAAGSGAGGGGGGAGANGGAGASGQVIIFY